MADRPTLEKFLAEWKWHDPLTPEQLEFTGRRAKVEDVGLYHGGEELYRLKGLPGVWHEACLVADD